MATYRIFIKPSAAQEIERLPTKKLRGAIVARIRALADDPRPPGCVKLSGADKYRLRQGDYRILYEIVADRLSVTVVRVAHRKSAYRGCRHSASLSSGDWPARGAPGTEP